MNVGSYETFDYRHAINGSIANSKLLFVDLAAYLLYRRTGLEFAIITQDWTLARQNKVGLVARCRYGGALIDGAAAAIMSDSQA
jgi:HK97 family phage major capsid protein